MCKGNSGHCKGTIGDKKWSGGSGGIPPLFDNGHVSKEGIEAHREEFIGKSVEHFVEMLKKNGYKVNVHDSNRKNKGSDAKIIEIMNTSKTRNITQVQVSPANNIHGVPYVKISIQNERKVKVVDGRPKDYRNGENEKAYIIFKEE